MNRNLDGIYFRIKRDDKFENICFSDLTKEERETLFSDETKYGIKWWKNLSFLLADTIKMIGDTFDIIVREDDEEEDH